MDNDIEWVEQPAFENSPFRIWHVMFMAFSTFLAFGLYFDIHLKCSVYFYYRDTICLLISLKIYCFRFLGHICNKFRGKTTNLFFMI